MVAVYVPGAKPLEFADIRTSPAAAALVEPLAVTVSQLRFDDARQVIGIVLTFRTDTAEPVVIPGSVASATFAELSVSLGEIVKYTAPTPLLFPLMPTMTSRAPSPVTSNT